MTNENNNNQNITPEDIKNIREEYKKVKRILTNIKALGNEYEKLNNLLKDENTGVEAIYNKVVSKQKEIETLKEKSQIRLTEIEDNLKKVKGNIDEMQTAYNEFSEIKGKVSEKSKEINGIKDTAENLKKDIERIKVDAQKTLDQTRVLLQDMQKKIKEMEGAYKDFLTIKSKIDDKKTGLQVIMDQVQVTNSKSSEVYEKIQTYRDESAKLVSNIKDNLDNSNKIKEDIVKTKGIVDERKIEIEEVTGRIVATGFASSFQRRAKSLWKSSIFWAIILFLGVIGLAILLYVFFNDQEGVPKVSFVIYRLSLSSPLLFLIGFAVKQYSRDREYNEKYAFKFSIATVIRNHIDFLLKIFPEYKKEIMFFCKSSMEMLYKEPYEIQKDICKKINNIEKEVKAFNKNDNKDKQLFGYVEEIKKLFPDSEDLKKLYNLLPKE